MHYSKLDVWQKAIDLSILIYQTTATFPNDERFGLTSQMRRAAVSIASNIAEGEGRRGWADRAHFYVNARGSLSELETQIVISKRLAYFSESAALKKAVKEVGQLINGTLRNLEKRRIADS